MKNTTLSQQHEADLQTATTHLQHSFSDSLATTSHAAASNDRAYYMRRYTDELATCSSSEFSEHQGYKKPKRAYQAAHNPNARAEQKSELNASTIRPKATAHTLKNDTRMQPQLARTTQSAAHKQPVNIDIPERTFMNGLIKHTVIALAIIIPLAAFSAYAATPEAYSNMQAGFAPASQYSSEATQAVRPNDIMYNQSTTPTAVDSVDLEKYVGTWYEIARLPMYFQRKCAGDVTATYTLNSADNSVGVLNKCKGDDGELISADGIARVADDSGSKLKVTFLPSWLRWLPVGRADYWVLARDADYNTALVGTPDNKYLWLLARTPDISADTYTKYRQIATNQGYDLSEFTLTKQSGQTVDLNK